MTSISNPFLQDGDETHCDGCTCPDEFEESVDDDICDACRDTGFAYLSDGVWGACMLCSPGLMGFMPMDDEDKTETDPHSDKQRKQRDEYGRLQQRIREIKREWRQTEKARVGAVAL